MGDTARAHKIRDRPRPGLRIAASGTSPGQRVCAPTQPRPHPQSTRPPVSPLRSTRIACSTPPGGFLPPKLGPAPPRTRHPIQTLLPGAWQCDSVARLALEDAPAVPTRAGNQADRPSSRVCQAPGCSLVGEDLVPQDRAQHEPMRQVPERDQPRHLRHGHHKEQEPLAPASDDVSCSPVRGASFDYSLLVELGVRLRTQRRSITQSTTAHFRFPHALPRSDSLAVRVVLLS